MSDIEFEHDETETGGTKRPTKVRLKAMHPEHGQVGWLDYHVPRRKADKIYVDRLEVDPEHQGNGYASRLMDEMQRRHPNTPIDHGDRTDDGQAWWAGYTRDKKVTRGRTMASRKTASDHQVWFHGTRPENVPHIREHGLSAPPGMASPFYMQLTDNHEQAKVYAGPGGKVLEYHIPHGEVDARLGEVHPHNMFNQNGRAAPIRTSVPSQYIAAEHDVPSRTATRRTAGDDWNFEHFQMGSGPSWRTMAGPKDDPRKHMVEYRVSQPGKVKFDSPTFHLDRVRKKDGDEAAEKVRSGILDHHKATELTPEEEEAAKPPEKPQRRVYYHGTTVEDVTHILPANHHGQGVVFPHVTSRDHAYATTSHSDAWNYAEKAWAAKGSGRPRVYQVRPIGGHQHVEKDPAFDEHGRSRSNNDADVRSKKGFEVVREMKWPKHMGNPEEWDS